MTEWEYSTNRVGWERWVAEVSGHTIDATDVKDGKGIQWSVMREGGSYKAGREASVSKAKARAIKEAKE